MKIKLSSLKADLAREEQGDWVEYPDWPGVAFNVSSLHKPSYAVARDQLLQRLARKYKGKPIPPDVLSSESGKLYAAEILHGWRGFDIEYSKDTAGDTLADPAFRELVSAIEWCASQISRRDAEFVEEQVKNSARPSSGSSTKKA